MDCVLERNVSIENKLISLWKCCQVKMFKLFVDSSKVLIRLSGVIENA